MKKLAPVLSFIVLAVGLLNLASLRVGACGPSFLEPIFAFDTRPDLDLRSFAAGRIGIIQPTYNRTFLFAAYRNFNNHPFTPDEQAALEKVWRAELYREDDNEIKTNEAVKNWIAERKKVLVGEDEPKIYTARTYDNGYEFFPNCTANAFQTATETLRSRAAKYGASSEAVKDWTRAQDTVFSNCAQGKSMPADAANTAPDWLKRDRAYQIAAAKFYAAEFEDARARFEQISAERDSPWAKTAEYLTARALIRQASLIEGDDYAKLAETRRPFYEQAQGILQKMISAPETPQNWRESAAALLNLLKYRLNPNERVHELAAILSQPVPNADLRQNVIDYRWLLDRLNEKAFALAEARANDAAKKAGKDYAQDYVVARTDYPSIVTEDDLTDFIVTFQDTSVDAFRHSFDKWKENNSTAWLAAALAKADKSNAETSELLTAADRLEKNSPAFATVAFHQNRLLIETGKRTQAKEKLDFILNNRMTIFPLSARNEFTSQRMMLAENLDEFLRLAQRKAVAFSYDGVSDSPEDFAAAPKQDDKDYYKSLRFWKNHAMFDTDAARVMNEQFPLSVLKQSLASPKLPDYLKRQILIAAWTKAILLNEDQTARELAPNFARYAPEFLPLMNQYVNAKTAAERSGAATYVLLKFPALRPFVEAGFGRIIAVNEIDSFRDNWWRAPLDIAFDKKTGAEISLKNLPALSFLTADQLSKAAEERAKLKSLGEGATYLALRAVEFAQKSPADSRVPESLHLAVRATRYGPTDCNTGRYSKQAFDILKTRFPASEWKKKTPYWFKDESCGK
jgi:hypothetical protein